MVFRRRIKTLNDLAFLRILMMSSDEESEESEEGDCGNEGTNGDVVGACASVIVE